VAPLSRENLDLLTAEVKHRYMWKVDGKGRSAVPVNAAREYHAVAVQHRFPNECACLLSNVLTAALLNDLIEAVEHHQPITRIKGCLKDRIKARGGAATIVVPPEKFPDCELGSFGQHFIVSGKWGEYRQPPQIRVCQM
jgi:hypothetical protein